MKHTLFAVPTIMMISLMPIVALAQNDSSKSIVAGSKIDSAAKTGVAAMKSDSASLKKDSTNSPSDSVVATPMNCYKQWMDAFHERGVKPVEDGEQEVVIAFKSKESCHCYLGKVEISGGKIKAPLYVKTEGGSYKTFVAMGKKLDADFIADQGDALWLVTGGMSVLFQTVDHEFGRIFFYKALNKDKQANKEAPSPSDLLK